MSCLSDSPPTEEVLDTRFGNITITYLSSSSKNSNFLNVKAKASSIPDSFWFSNMYDNGLVTFGYSNNHRTSVNKRSDIRACSLSVTHAGVCIAGGAFGSQVVKDIVSGIKSLSDKNNCNSDLAVIQVHRDTNVYWKADEITGSCHTTALAKTIEGALDENIGKKHGKKICDFQCFRLTHGGKWTAYVKFGTDRYLVEHTDCSTVSGEYKECTSGGVNSGKNL